ncbi:unnamed protein product, partial [Allacma fusca]
TALEDSGVSAVVKYRTEGFRAMDSGFQSQIPGGGNAGGVVSVEYEVFGQVQGCYFTKYLKEICDQRSVGGWVKNSKSGTILGKLQGPRGTVDEM